MKTGIVIERGTNYYKEGIQGKANEPITVAGLLDRAKKELAIKDIDYSLEEIYDRLENNAPRIAIITGSPDHPAHILDYQTTSEAAYRIWQNGGVPFSFGVPVLCDATVQSNIGMSYSLQSRNTVTGMVVNQMEAHSYHGAFVIQGCDKTPFAIVSALTSLDFTRQENGEAPVFASFAPSHVLRGGTMPDDLRSDLEAVADKAERLGKDLIAEDIRDALKYILQCSSTQAFQGILIRAVQEGVITFEYQKQLEKRLVVNTCDGKGGICAFNGTGNSSRHAVSALGLVHPAVELLVEPPTQQQTNQAIDAMFTYCNNPEYSVSNMVVQNFENAVRVHSTTGGSTNLVNHMVAAMIHAGYKFDVWKYDEIRRKVPIPDLFDYSLTQGRDIFALAKQCCDGFIRGMETVIYELVQNGVPMNLQGPTVTGTTWEKRFEDRTNLGADGVKNNPIILSKPRRAISGIDILRGNFFESAVVKISGMLEPQVDEFDGKVFFVLYYENEDEANHGLLNVNLLSLLKSDKSISRQDLLKMYECNKTSSHLNPAGLSGMTKEELFDYMVRERLLKIAVVISGQGPEAYGMPEMFTPMLHINSNRELRRLVVLMSDGRYSGVTYGAAIGHVTPEAKNGGSILYLETGDVLEIRLRERIIRLLEKESFRNGQIVEYRGDLSRDRKALGEQRLQGIEQRLTRISPTNRMRDITDVAHGVVPRVIAEQATKQYMI